IEGGDGEGGVLTVERFRGGFGERHALKGSGFMTQKAGGAVEPAGRRASAIGDARFHVVLGVEVRATVIWGADAVDDGQVLVFKVLQQGLKAGVKTKLTI